MSTTLPEEQEFDPTSIEPIKEPVEMKLAQIEYVDPKSLVPYEDNARTITDRAVAAVLDSIKQFGFVQPLVANKDRVLLVGHTRLRAALEMNLPKVPVIFVSELTEDQEKEYRLVDNKTGEMTGWDQKMLALELREFSQAMLDEYFPDFDLDVEQSVAEQITDADLDKAADKVLTISKADAINSHETRVHCPNCEHEFGVRTRSLPGLTWGDLSQLVYGDE